ncbi:hypothetical protein MKA27_17325 [[Clostridium] innocuum]|uniref:hypothetical protein n=1 Tax=Clostridium innocuum TaxID=1522 RepID=UPI000D6C5C86|nr:hypothetical protein [[Clostridium] innocuum]MCR0315826.1 hypothetical protein [[Clostridium] innocuum]MCR0370972.1 hypothetical protein [[Clostridium] innocuum]MCR0375573.1 hypothetical protein [[Clostridium] innocuum]MCR0560949.1 hypothetical protein [[Clostridium] innocuum]MCR0603723.1 hypothetical protein [[Clostridium] innocuum]
MQEDIRKEMCRIQPKVERIFGNTKRDCMQTYMKLLFQENLMRKQYDLPYLNFSDTYYECRNCNDKIKMLVVFPSISQ